MPEGVPPSVETLIHDFVEDTLPTRLKGWLEIFTLVMAGGQARL
jgi:hypothetical protein